MNQIHEMMNVFIHCSLKSTFSVNNIFKLYMHQESTLTKKLELQKTTISEFQYQQDTSQVEMTLFIPWVPPREVQVDHLALELTLAGGRTGLRPWESARISLKTEWGTGGLLKRELEVLCAGVSIIFKIRVFYKA